MKSDNSVSKKRQNKKKIMKYLEKVIYWKQMR